MKEQDNKKKSMPLKGVRIDFNQVKNKSEIIDMDFEDFKKFIAKQNMGYVSGMLNLLKLTYKDVTVKKDGLEKDAISLSGEAFSERMDLVKMLFIYAFRIEEKILYLEKERNRRLLN